MFVGTPQVVSIMQEAHANLPHAEDRVKDWKQTARAGPAVPPAGDSDGERCGSTTSLFSNEQKYLPNNPLPWKQD